MAKQATQQKEKIKLVTHEFRVSYPHVFKAQAFGKNDPQFSVTMLFSKKSDMKAITDAIKQAKIAKWGSKENWPKMTRPVYLDGDAPELADKEGYKGHWIIKAHAKEDQRPEVVNEDVEPITDASEFYPGCYARAQVLVQAWDNEFGKGISFYLDHVQKLRDGKSFAGKKPADQVFTPVNTGRSDDDDDSDDSSDDDDEDFT